MEAKTTPGAHLDLLARGYSPEPPTFEAEGIDRAVCEEDHCTKCHHEGMVYRPYTRRGSRFSYIAFAVCPACGYEEEL